MEAEVIYLQGLNQKQIRSVWLFNRLHILGFTTQKVFSSLK